MSTEDGRLVAVVLSGGGANGAYEVGVLKALMGGQSEVTNYQPLQPDIITGTSVGAINAAFLVSQWDEYGAAAIGNLERFWLERLAGGTRSNGVFRFRANPLALLDPAAYLPNPLRPLTEFLRDGAVLGWEAVQRAVHFATSARAGALERKLLELVDVSAFISLEPLERTLQAIDYRAIQRSTLRLKVAATNWATGQLRVFWNHDMTEAFGPAALRASAAVPALFPPAEFGSQPFVDGSVLMVTPLSPAIHAGAEILHVIYLDPDVSSIPLDRLRHVYSTAFRVFQIGWAAAYNDDIGDAAKINRSLAAVARAAAALQGGEETAAMLAEVAQIARPPGTAPRRPLVIHRYHPTDPLAGQLSLLNFDRDRLERLIERGFQDAVHHDHAQARDVFPEGSATSEGESHA